MSTYFKDTYYDITYRNIYRLSPSIFYRYVHGCVMSCDDVDACNSATQTMDNNLFKTTSSLPFVTKYLVLIVLARTVNTTFLPKYINT